MFDIGWSELIVVAVVALIAIGPKELPGVLRMVGQWMGKARKMAGEFQGQFQEAMREAEMADLKKTFDDVKDAATGFASGNIMTSLQKDVSDALKIDDIDKSAPDAQVESADRARRQRPPRRKRRFRKSSPPPTPMRRRASRWRSRARFRRSRPPQDIAPPAADVAEGRQSVMSAEDIEASKAPLMDHLIELRSRLIKALLGVRHRLHPLLLLRQADL